MWHYFCQIMECLLQLRADNLHRLGLPGKKKDGRIWYSPYVVCLTRSVNIQGLEKVNNHIM